MRSDAFRSLTTLVHADDERSTSSTRHGAYLCLNLPTGVAAAGANAVADLVARFGLMNEFDGAHPSTAPTVAFVRRTELLEGNVIDDRLAGATGVVHISSESAALVVDFQSALADALGAAHRPAVLAGVARPLRYTGNAMHNYAYAHRVVQQSGVVMPCAFLIPLTKTPAWWKKNWMERHTYFLPRYDDAGRMINQGHALAAAPGISCLMRRTYWNAVEPAPAGEYDFVTYFECAEADVPIFETVCAALRDTRKNPEWAFVSEGPTWCGRRVATWNELFM